MGSKKSEVFGVFNAPGIAGHGAGGYDKYKKKKKEKERKSLLIQEAAKVSARQSQGFTTTTEKKQGLNFDKNNSLLGV